MRMSKHMKEDLRRERRASRPWEWVQIVLFFTVMGALTVLGLLLPLRPTYSEEEKRELAKFPAFSAQALVSGSYFDDIVTWYADTFPLRELWVSVDGARRHYMGLSFTRIHGEVETGDEIPDAPVPTLPTYSSTTTTTATTTVTTASTTAETTVTTTNTTTAITTTVTTTTTRPPMQEVETEEGILQTQKFDAVLQVDDAAYEYFNFRQSVADRYGAMVTHAAGLMGDKAKVWVLIPPNSMGVMLPDGMRDRINSSDQGKASNYIISKLGGGAVGVPIYETLRAHRDEYIYFRTDHHWTATGAYYAYEQLMLAMGKTPAALDSFETEVKEGFLGTFYYDTEKSPALGSHPDTIVAYKPKGDAKMTFTNQKGKKVNWPIISGSNKYYCFIGGDNPYTVIQNRSLNDGSACVVIKESYGNALVPFLVDHYQTVHVIDYRYYTPSLVEFVAQNPVQDVIFVNNISVTRSSNSVGLLEEFVGCG
ncbi:MAG: hypothetical protein J6K98_01060 [Clostridia bacterium]|nr:hypothetical protein [Clostridia bacterium]